MRGWLALVKMGMTITYEGASGGFRDHWCNASVDPYGAFRASATSGNEVQAQVAAAAAFTKATS